MNGGVQEPFAAAPARRELTPDGQFPLNLRREDEQRLYRLIRSGDLHPERWLAEGPAFFMAGLAVLLAGSAHFPRRPLLSLADSLHPGIVRVEVYNDWLRHTPIEPSRFFSQLLSAA